MKVGWSRRSLEPGTVVEVRPAYRMPEREGGEARYAPDGAEGIYTVQEMRGEDALLVRGVLTADQLAATGWEDVAVHRSRLWPLIPEVARRHLETSR